MTAPVVPDIASGSAQFSTDMRAFHSWEAGELWAAVDAFFAGRLISTTGTSTSSVLIGTGDKTFTTQAGLGYVTGMPLNVVNTANPANYMSGFVKSYSGTTLVVTVISTGGSGTLAAWSIALGLSGGGATLGGNTFTALQNFAVGANIASAATINLSTAGGNTVHITGTVAVSAVTMNSGEWVQAIYDAACPLTYHATSHKLNTGGQNVTLEAGDSVWYYRDSTICYGFIMKLSGKPVKPTNYPVPVRQTVLSGPVDSSGNAAFGGSTGSTTVTAAGTLIATSANGFDIAGEVNRIGSIVNPSWTGLSTNGTMYLYLDIAVDGTCTPGSGTLAPTYRPGGADVVTSGQFTFNIQEMSGKVGNGASAAQTYRVYVGEVTVAGAVVTAIIWYALLGRATTALFGLALSTNYSNNHYLGVLPQDVTHALVCQTAEFGYAINDEVTVFPDNAGTANTYSLGAGSNRLAAFISTMPTGISIANRSSTNSITIAVGNWKLRSYIRRGW